MKIDEEVSDKLMAENAQALESEVGKALSDNMSRVDEVRQDIENKYANQKSMLIAGYERAKTEEMVH